MNRRHTDDVTDHTRAPEIVVGLDDSPSARAALRWAAEHSRSTGWPLVVTYAWQLDAFATAAASAELLEAERADARARATRWVLDTLGAAATQTTWSLEVEMGAPGPVLVSRSRDARLLVLGTQEHRGVRRAVLGSVSHYCLAHAPVPVVAVPAPRTAPPAPRSSREMASGSV